MTSRPSTLSVIPLLLNENKTAHPIMPSFIVFNISANSGFSKIHSMAIAKFWRTRWA